MLTVALHAGGDTWCSSTMPTRPTTGRRRWPPTATTSPCSTSADDLVRYAHELYARLRHADAAGHDVVVAVRPPPHGLGHAIRDRLQKAAAR